MKKLRQIVAPAALSVAVLSMCFTVSPRVARAEDTAPAPGGTPAETGTPTPNVLPSGTKELVKGRYTVPMSSDWFELQMIGDEYQTCIYKGLRKDGSKFWLQKAHTVPGMASMKMIEDRVKDDTEKEGFKCEEMINDTMGGHPCLRFHMKSKDDEFYLWVAKAEPWVFAMRGAPKTAADLADMEQMVANTKVDNSGKE
jgi:hypothetical protein